MNSYWLVICIFVIGFGWGAAVMTIFFWRKAEDILESCRRVIKLQKKLLESEDNVQKKMFVYADLVKKSFDISCQHTDHVVEGLNKLIEAVRKEDIDEMTTIEPQIVRCKECKHWTPYDWMFSEVWQSRNIADYPEDEIGCALNDMVVKANDFCSRGEKREVTE